MGDDMLGIYCRTSVDNDTEKSTISQQKTAGIKFAEENNFEYEIYEDKGISGFKISDDDTEPFNNRPAFTNLINDIKNRKIDKVWVWEHSRLSRKQYASAFIFNIFEKYKIILYENQKEYKPDDPQLNFMRQMLDAVSEYERELIVARTTRGTRKRIDEGKRAHVKLYGYGKAGRDENGYTIWIPIESEINTIRYAINRYMDGVSLSQVCNEIYDMNKIEKKLALRRAFTLGRILRKYQYTGFQLTIEGYDIFKRFRKNEIESIQILLDRKFWIKSRNYPIEIINIEDWVRICERLQIQSRNISLSRKDRILRAKKDIATGIIECNECGIKFYYKDQIKKYKSGNTYHYRCYYHHSTFTKTTCKQKPRSFALGSINEIFKLFYFYYLVVFDNRNEQIKESQRNIKQAQLKIKEKMTKLEKEIPAIEGRINRFRIRLDNTADDLIDTLLRQIKDSEIKLEKQNIELSKLKIEYEIQNEKFNKAELEMTFYDVAERVNDWFYKLNIEDQRNELIRLIRSCKIFNQYLIIDTGKIVFMFDIRDNHKFDMKLLENLNKGVIFKDHFIELKNKKDVRRYNEKLIPNINLNRDENIRGIVFQYLLENYSIAYNLNNTNNLVSFVSLRGLYSQDEE
jgi:DNA invertase Pin-like site-specific DNA recombinase